MAKTLKKKNNKTQQIIIRIIVVLFLIFLFYIIFQKEIRKVYFRYFYEEKFIPGRMYFPEAYQVFGIDISRYQSKMHWDDLKAISTYGDTIELTFVIMKASEGRYTRDRHFKKHVENVRKIENVTVGAYHFFHPDKDPKLQAENFIKTADLQPGDLVPVIDIEETNGVSKSEIIKSLKIILRLLEEKYQKKPIIYSYKDFILKYLADDFKEYPFWVAHYYEKDIEMPSELDVKFWQFTDKGKTMVFNGFIDVNAFLGNSFELNRLKIP